MNSNELKQIVEALFFVADGPLNKKQIAQVLENVPLEDIEQAINQLKEEYENSTHAFNLVEVAGGYGFRTKSDYAFWLRKFKKVQATRLSRAAMETLAIVAYRQPIMKAEVEKIRGVEVGSMLRTLMEKDLVRIVGRQDLPGRPLIYGTTRKFLEVFDLNDLSDLPTLDELKDLAPIDRDELMAVEDDDSHLPTLEEVRAMQDGQDSQQPEETAISGHEEQANVSLAADDFNEQEPAAPSLEDDGSYDEDEQY